MHLRILSRIRANIVAYVALFVALGGTSVAAISLANHSIDPVKLNPNQIGGYIRAWASVTASGHVAASGGRVTVRTGSAFPGRYFFTWHTKLTSACRVIGSVDTGAGGVPGYLTGGFTGIPRKGPTGIVYTYDSHGQPTPQPFNVELVCSTPR